MNAPVLSARGLVKRYGSPPGGVTALDGVDVDVDAGESLAIMGASGSGKTTLLHALAGIVGVDAGQVVLTPSGTDPSQALHVESMGDAGRSRLRRESFGFVFQQGLLVPELTALENVALAVMLNGGSRRAAEQAAEPWLERLGLGGLGGRRTGELSGGQAQRVAIARALVAGPSVVFADEPTGALDSTTSGEVLDALLAATTGPQADGRARCLVVVTHEASIAARCRRTLHLRDGRVVGEPTARSTATPTRATP